MTNLLLGAGQPLGRGRMDRAGSLRDAELAAIVCAYKKSVAGAYVTIPPDSIAAKVPSGKHILSTKVDGEQWFLYKNGHGSILLSPNGKAITGVPVTEEADGVLAGWSGLLAGELYVTLTQSRPLGKAPSVSLRDAVFLRMREDKAVALPDVRWGQVAGFAPADTAAVAPAELPASTILRREVYVKNVRGGGLAIRKLVVWKTNKDEADPRFPAYAAVFTDYSPARQEPMATDLRVASKLEHIAAAAERWLAENIRRGWKCMIKTGDSVATSANETLPPLRRATTHTLTIAFARSTSPTFPIVRRRLDALAELGALKVTTDGAGKEAWFELTITAGLVENYRRIANILNLVRRWKSTEIVLNAEPLDKFSCDTLMNRLEQIRQCWSRRKAAGPAGCRRDCALGCRAIQVAPSQRFMEGAYVTEPPWYAVGRFERGQVEIDKSGLAGQVNRRRNRLLEACPNFDAAAVAVAIEVLPATLSPDDAGYRLVYARDNGMAAWVWPEHATLPPRVCERDAGLRGDNGVTVGLGFGVTQQFGPALSPPAQLPRATYADVRGQDAAVEAVRDLIELPMKHAALFEAVGVSAKPSGVILAGPPGTGKTLLARAVASECGAHLEIISGPELLNPYVGATEQALREVFDRARRKVPALILFDELDGLAPARDDADAHHQRSVVAQLRALLDGLRSRANVFVLATTNRPRAIDTALRRPGRFDRVVWMRRPDCRGRAAILTHYLQPLRLSRNLNVDTLAAELAAATLGASGADLESLCQTAARICVKEAVGRANDLPPVITERHFRQALHECFPQRRALETTATA